MHDTCKEKAPKLALPVARTVQTVAVPCTDLFLRSKLATVATKFIVKLAAAIVTATTRRSVATLAYLADALDRRANWVATLSEPALAVLVNATSRSPQKHKTQAIRR